MWRKAAYWLIFGALILFIVAVGFPIVAGRRALSYSGPGLLRDALLIDLQGQQATNREVELYLRGHKASLTAKTDDLGIVHVKEGERVDGIVGFERFFPSLPDENKKIHPVFWECDPAKGHVVYTWWSYHATGDRPYVNWPTRTHPQVTILGNPPSASPAVVKKGSVN